MGDFDDDVSIINAFGLTEKTQAKAKLTPLQKDMLFGLHYGMGTNKLSNLGEYAEADIEATMALYKDTYMKKVVGFLFLGGSLHGQRVDTYGDHVYHHKIPVAANKHAVYAQNDDPVSVTVGWTIETYVRKNIMLPAGKSVSVYVPEKDSGSGASDVLIADFMELFFSPVGNSVNTPILPPMPEPIPAPPVQVADGLRITIGGKTIEWTPDDSQLAGLLSWAAQSLGPGKDVK